MIEIDNPFKTLKKYEEIQKLVDSFDSSLVSPKEIEFNQKQITYDELENPDVKYKKIAKIVDKLYFLFDNKLLTKEKIEEITKYLSSLSYTTCKRIATSLNRWIDYITLLNKKNKFSSFDEIYSFINEVFDYFQKRESKEEARSKARNLLYAIRIFKLLFDIEKIEWKKINKEVTYSFYHTEVRKTPSFSDVLLFLEAINKTAESIFKGEIDFMQDVKMFPVSIFNINNWVTFKIMCYVAMTTGMRRIELFRLKKEHLIFETKQPLICVIGKGLKKRVIPVGEKVKNIIEEYLKYVDSLKKTNLFKETDYVFVFFKYYDKFHRLNSMAFTNTQNFLQKLTYFNKFKLEVVEKERSRIIIFETFLSLVNRYIFKNEHKLKKLLAEKGIIIDKPYEKVTFHQLRHFYATYTYFLTKDLLAIKEKLGHSDIKTTMKYAKYIRELDETVKISDDLINKIVSIKGQL